MHVLGTAPPDTGRAKKRAAYLDGFSLHAAVHLHANDREGLAHLCGYGARPPFSQERLSELPDGRLTYRLKRPLGDGPRYCCCSPPSFCVVSPRWSRRRAPTSSATGVFAPASRWRSHVIPRLPESTPFASAPACASAPVQPEDPAPAATEAPLPDQATAKAQPHADPSRIPWAELLMRVFREDVLACPCGGRRVALACLTQPGPVRAKIGLLVWTLSASPSAHAGEVKMLDAQPLETNKQLVRKLYEDCINPGKLELLDALFSQDYTSPQGKKGPAAFAGVVVSLRRGFPDVRFTIEDLIAEGDRVTVRWTWLGTHTGPFQAFPPSGKPVTNTGTVIYQLKERKIIRSWLEADRLGVLQQIGVVPKDLTASPTSRDVRHISVPIDRPPHEVYDFASKPENLPQWATGLGGSIKKVNGEWVADAPMARITIRMTKKNALGVLDHDVVLESGAVVHNPARVFPRGRGSEVVFTLFRQPGVTDEKFSEDARWVEKDLNILKGLLER